MSGRKVFAHELVSFRAVCKPFPISYGNFTSAMLEQRLLDGGVHNFAKSYFEANKTTKYPIPKERSHAILVEVNAPRPCPIDQAFADKARSVGFIELDQAAGPLIAIVPGLDFHPILVITKPFPMRPTDTLGFGGLLWKILKPAKGNVSITTVNANERIEGKKMLAFAPLSTPE